MFKKRCVVCLDILGFKNLIVAAESSPAGLLRLQGLRTVLDAHVMWDNQGLADSVPDTHVPKYLFISDTIIISTPGDAMGARAAVVKSIQIYQKAVEAGHLIRGAMVLGNVWHDDRNIFGTGWITAFDSQEKDAIHPRVIVSTEISDLLGDDVRETILIKDVDGRWICDVLHPAYIREAQLQGGIEVFYRQVKAQIATGLAELGNDSSKRIVNSARSKWQWTDDFLKKSLTRHGYDADHF